MSEATYNVRCLGYVVEKVEGNKISRHHEAGKAAWFGMDAEQMHGINMLFEQTLHNANEMGAQHVAGKKKDKG